MKIYLVGGALRDIYMNKKPKDFDFVVVGSSVEEMLSLGYINVGKAFPVFLHKDTKQEYALARSERKNGNGYRGFEVDFQNTTLEEDLFRRDLTINAVAKCLETNKIIDPFNGIDDIQNKILKPVSKHFKDDPVRILRVARFHAILGFKISEEILEMAKEMKRNGELSFLTPSRILKELTKVFEAAEKPSTFFSALQDMNVLDIIFPEIHALIGVPQVELYHPEGCAYTHIMLVLDSAKNLNGNFDEMFACLTHDFGKAITEKSILPKHIGHETAGISIVENFCNRLQVQNRTKKLSLLFTEHHLTIHRAFELSEKKLVVLLRDRLKCLKNINLLEKILLCAKADALGKNNSDYKQEGYLINVFNLLNSINSKEIIEKNKNKKPQDSIHEEMVRVLKKNLKK